MRQRVPMLSTTRPAAMVVALVVLALPLAACRGGDVADGPRETTTELKPVTFSRLTESAPQPKGRFYAVMSARAPDDEQLYELRFSPPNLRRLSPTKRVTAVGACDSRVVVTLAQEETDFTDYLHELQGQDFVPLEDLGPVAALGPSVRPDCRVAYTLVDRNGPVPTAELRTWDPVRKQGRTLYRTRPGDGPLVGASWGPNGEVAVLRLPPETPDPSPGQNPTKGRQAAVIVVRPNGFSFEVDPGTLDPVGLTWGKTMIAVGDGEASTILVRPSGGKRTTIDGWRPLAWSPEGDTLLVRDAATGGVIGLLDPNNGSVKEVGRLTGSVFDVDWLPR